MTKRGAVHVFIGAPDALSSRGEDLEEERRTDNDTQPWNEIIYVYNDRKGSCLQENHNKSDAMLYHGSDALPHSRQCLHNCAVHESQLISIASSFPTLKSYAEDSVAGDFSALVSSAEHCKSTPNPQTDLKNITHIIHSYLESTFPKQSQQPEDKTVPSTTVETPMYTEPPTVLTSSQIVLCHLEGLSAQSESDTPNNLEKIFGTPKVSLAEPSVCKETVAAECLPKVKTQKCWDGSLELFTPTPDDIQCIHTSFSKLMPHHQENVRDVKESSDFSFGESSNLYNCTDTPCRKSRVFTDKESSPSALEMQPRPKISKSDGLQSHSRPFVDEEIFQKWFDSLVPLKCCSDAGKACNILVAVVHPCHVKEVKAKTGPNAGSSIPLATIVVMDHTVLERKVVMWRSAAFWTLEVFPGDIIILTNLVVCDDRWNEETILQSTAKSKLLNLGNCSVLCKESLDAEYTVLKELLEHLSVRHHYLINLPPRHRKKQDSLPYSKHLQLQPETIVHSLVKISDISMLTECSYHYKQQRQNKVILTVEDVMGHTGTIVLRGTCIAWFDQIRLKKDHIWEFRHLFAHKNSVSGDVELHTTPWSSYECLFDDDSRAIGFKNKYYQCIVLNAKQMDLSCLLQEKYCGNVLLNAFIMEFFFSMSDQTYVFMDHKTSLSDIMAYLPKIIFSGCGKCQRELKTDKNHVYEQCLPCLPFNQVKMFYRPALMTINCKESTVRVHVPSDVIEKLFLNIPPSILNKFVLFTSNVTYGMVIADLCHSILEDTGESYILKIRSHFVLDENSMEQEQDFYLLNIHLSL